LIGFDWSEYKCLDDARRQAFIEEFEARYLSWAGNIVKQVEAGVKTFPHKQLRFDFFFMPFKDVQVFRDYFDDALRDVDGLHKYDSAIRANIPQPHRS